MTTFPDPLRRAQTDRASSAGILLGLGLVCVLAWQTQIGRLVLYPFTILSTWFHEMGHGLAALVVGRSFESLVLYPDGSGVAMTMRPADGHAIVDAFIAASGPIGPAVAGALLILSSRSPAATRRALLTLGAVLALTTLIWVRSLVGWIVLPILALAILALAIKGSARLQHVAIQFLGVEAAISVWSQFGYLFSTAGVEAGQLSDTAAIAEALWLPYWVWGTLLSGMTLAILIASLWSAYRR